MPRRTDLNDIRAILRRDADETLVAAAGTHLLSRRERVATIGNVYARRDCRGRGLGRTVMSAVLEALADIDTIGLNVRVDNRAAIRVYASLGFVRHCPFYKRSRREPVGFPTRRPSGGVASSVTPARPGGAPTWLLPPRAWPDERLVRTPPLDILFISSWVQSRPPRRARARLAAEWGSPGPRVAVAGGVRGTAPSGEVRDQSRSP